MRTTVTLDDDVVRLVQDEMHRRRRSFKQSLNEAVRAALAPRRGGSAPFVVEGRAMGLRAGYDRARLGQLADELETEALVERMGRAEAAERQRQAQPAMRGQRRGRNRADS